MYIEYCHFRITLMFLFHPITMHEYIYEHIKNKYIDDLHQQYKERYSRKL